MNNRSVTGLLPSALAPKLAQSQQSMIGKALPIIVGILVVSIALAALGPPRSHIIVISLVAIAAAVSILLRRPPLGIVALVVLGLIAPFSLETGSYSRINIAILILVGLLGLWIVQVAIRSSHGKLIWSRPMAPLLAFGGVAVLSFGFGQINWYFFASNAPLRAQLGGLAIFLLSIGAFMLVAHQVTSVKWLKYLTWTFLVIGAVFIAGWFLPGFDRLTRLVNQNRAAGSVFWVWLAAIAFSQAVANHRLRQRTRVALGGLTLATFAVGLGLNSHWTSGWLPALVATIVVLWFTYPRLALICTVIAAIAAVFRIEGVTALLLIGGNQYSFDTRLEAWRILAEVVKVSPILGLGPANYFWYTPLFPIFGWQVNFNSHNNYVDIVAQTGILGLICFLWFCLEIGRLGIRLLGKIPGGFQRAYAIGGLGGLAGTMVAGLLGDWVIPFPYNIGLAGFRASMLAWIFLGGLVALEQIQASSDVA